MNKLNFCIGGFHGENIKIFKYYTSIIVQTSDRPVFNDFDKISHHITKDQWIDFWSKMNQINIWDWKTDYFNQEVLDGTQWELVIGHKDKKLLKIFGSNAYPDNFQDFLDALNSLAGTEITYDKDI